MRGERLAPATEQVRALSAATSNGKLALNSTESRDQQVGRVVAVVVVIASDTIYF